MVIFFSSRKEGEGEESINYVYVKEKKVKLSVSGDRSKEKGGKEEVRSGFDHSPPPFFFLSDLPSRRGCRTGCIGRGCRVDGRSSRGSHRSGGIGRLSRPLDGQQLLRTEGFIVNHRRGFD